MSIQLCFYAVIIGFYTEKQSFSREKISINETSGLLHLNLLISWVLVLNHSLISVIPLIVRNLMNQKITLIGDPLYCFLLVEIQIWIHFLHWHYKKHILKLGISCHSRIPCSQKSPLVCKIGDLWKFCMPQATKLVFCYSTFWETG